MAELSTDTRNRLKSSTFGLPGSRKYPMPDKEHAANAKARATQMVKRGKLSSAAKAKIDAKANRVLGKSKRPGGVDEDLNAATLGRRAVARANGSDNRNPATPYQEDINNWKSVPVSERGKWMRNSQGAGTADDDGKGMDYSKQPKFGGTQVAGASKKAQPKIEGTTPETGMDYSKQKKFGGTAASQDAVNGKARGGNWANGSGRQSTGTRVGGKTAEETDAGMRSMIREH